MVIVGWTESDKSRGFRALLLGVHEGGKLRYAGKVGTGFDTATMLDLRERLEKLERKSPTVDAPRAATRRAAPAAGPTWPPVPASVRPACP